MFTVFGVCMKIYSDYNTAFYKPAVKKQSFSSAKDINLKYIYENRMYLLPDRIKKQVADIVENGKNISYTIRDIHIKTYSPIQECKTLDEAGNLFPEFRQVLNLNSVIVHKTPNVKEIMKHIPLEEFSLFVLKERWCSLKTLDEVSASLGLKSRAALGWFLDKIHMPDLGKNYQTILKASDEKLNNVKIFIFYIKIFCLQFLGCV